MSASQRIGLPSAAGPATFALPGSVTIQNGTLFQDENARHKLAAGTAQNAYYQWSVGGPNSTAGINTEHLQLYGYRNGAQDNQVLDISPCTQVGPVGAGPILSNVTMGPNTAIQFSAAQCGIVQIPNPGTGTSAPVPCAGITADAVILLTSAKPPGATSDAGIFTYVPNPTDGNFTVSCLMTDGGLLVNEQQTVAYIVVRL